MLTGACYPLTSGSERNGPVRDSQDAFVGFGSCLQSNCILAILFHNCKSGIWLTPENCGSPVSITIQSLLSSWPIKGRKDRTKVLMLLSALLLFACKKAHLVHSLCVPFIITKHAVCLRLIKICIKSCRKIFVDPTFN